MTIFSFLFFRYYLFLAILDIIILKNKKLLYMSTKDELTVSLSKSMTINDIQKELKASNIDFSAAKKKSAWPVRLPRRSRTLSRTASRHRLLPNA